jgi:sugar/nucleoside kinase (ribokinase family)
MPPVHVAVVGNLSLDRVEGAPPRAGGPPLYAGRALSALGVPAAVVAKCAERDRSRLLPALEELELPVELRSGSSTATYSFSYDGDRRTMEVLELGERWAPEDVGVLAEAEWIHVGALFRGEFPDETLVALTARGARLSFDGQGLVRPARLGPLELEPEADLGFLRHVSVLKLSEDEALALVPRLDERSLGELGVREVLVTLGSRGCLVLARPTLVHIPAEPLQGIDPTGAGDAFAAAYVLERSRRHAPPQAAQRATRFVHRLLERTRQ